MSQNLRKFIGTVATAIFVIVYALMAMALAVAVLPGAAWFGQLAFYAVAGLVWIVPVGLLIRWMSRPDAEKA